MIKPREVTTYTNANFKARNFESVLFHCLGLFVNIFIIALLADDKVDYGSNSPLLLVSPLLQLIVKTQCPFRMTVIMGLHKFFSLYYLRISVISWEILWCCFVLISPRFLIQSSPSRLVAI